MCDNMKLRDNKTVPTLADNMSNLTQDLSL